MNDFQLSNWEKRNDPLFNELVRNEKDFLFLVEYLLDNSTEIFADDPPDLVADVENFCQDLKMRLEYYEIQQVVDFISRAVIIISTILGFNQFVQNISRKEIFHFYSA